MQWTAQVEQMLIDLAEEELAAGHEVVTPCLAAFTGPHPRFLAFLREFDQGAYHAPMIELLALAAPLDVDRLAFMISGRAWSLQDPVVPVTEDADLRQRVLCIELVEAVGGRPRHTSVLLPFDPPAAGGGPGAGLAGSGPAGAAGVVSWEHRQVLAGGQGWIGSALTLAVSGHTRRRMRAPDAEIARQARRVTLLGHDLHLEPALAERLRRSLPAISPDMAAATPERRQDGPP